MANLYNVNKRDFKKVQFLNFDLSEKAYTCYSESSIEFYQSKTNGLYYLIDCGTAEEVGNLQDVNKTLELWFDEWNNDEE